MKAWSEVNVNEIIITDELRGEFGGTLDEMAVYAQVKPSMFEQLRSQVEEIARSALSAAGCVAATRYVWEDGFVPVFDDDGNEIGEEPMKLCYAFGDRLSTDRPPKHAIDRFYDEIGLFSYEVAHLR